MISSLANAYPLISRIQLIILIIARAMLKTMNKNHLPFQICGTPDECESTKDGYQVVLEGLGRNIIKKLGSVEFGRTVQYSYETERTKLSVV